MQEQKNEGCQVYGFLEVNKVREGLRPGRASRAVGWRRSTVNRQPTEALRRPEEGLENEREYPLQVAGNFHFAPGKSFQQSHVHGE